MVDKCSSSNFRNTLILEEYTLGLTIASNRLQIRRSALKPSKVVYKSVRNYERRRTR